MYKFAPVVGTQSVLRECPDRALVVFSNLTSSRNFRATVSLLQFHNGLFAVERLVMKSGIASYFP